MTILIVVATIEKKIDEEQVKLIEELERKRLGLAKGEF